MLILVASLREKEILGRTARMIITMHIRVMKERGLSVNEKLLGFSNILGE